MFTVGSEQRRCVIESGRVAHRARCHVAALSRERLTQGSDVSARSFTFTPQLYCYCTRLPPHAFYHLQFVMEVLVVLALLAAGALVHLGRDGVRHVGQLLLLLLKVLGRSLGTALLEPLSGLLNGVQDLASGQQCS